MPTLKRIFISSTDVRKKFLFRERTLLAPLQTLAHLHLPNGSCMYPERCIDELLNHTSGPVTIDKIHEFNRNTGQLLIAGTIKELQRRVKQRSATGELSIDDVAWLLGISRPPVARWCKEGTLPSHKVGGQMYIWPTDLLNRCRWVVPTTG